MAELMLNDKLYMCVKGLRFGSLFYSCFSWTSFVFLWSSLGLVHEDHDNGSSNSDLPAIVVYMIDPFNVSGVSEAKDPLWSLNGLIRAFGEMTSVFSDALKNNVFLQVLIPLCWTFFIYERPRPKARHIHCMHIECFTTIGLLNYDIHTVTNGEKPRLCVFGSYQQHQVNPMWSPPFLQPLASHVAKRK